MVKAEKVAVILFNLGAPDQKKAVRPFLFNLFRDPAIICLPLIPRYLFAFVISFLRYLKIKKIYEQLGGGSPLYPNTVKQAKALEKSLKSEKNKNFKIFISMRYWHPLAKETVKKVKIWNPSSIVLLPLYPQYSTTTTASSVLEWRKNAKKQKLNAKEYFICCYPTEKNFITAQAEKVRAGLKELKKKEKHENIRVLFSGHGLPKKISERGDPYRRQVEETAKTIAEYLKKDMPEWLVSYQSRVGPMEWLKPYTDKEIEKAGKEEKSLIIVPLTFTSEHSETLIELDEEYRELAQEAKVKHYIRVGTVGESADFINGLHKMTLLALKKKMSFGCHLGNRFCSKQAWACPCRH